MTGKEALMARGKDISINNYCDCVCSELSGMKSKLLDFASQIECVQGLERGTLDSHVAYLHGLANDIDQKMEIMTKVCPSDWTGCRPDVGRTSFTCA